MTYTGEHTFLTFYINNRREGKKTFKLNLIMEYF